ncbi:peptidase MA family metallohydrolase [Chloroflexota bacterium]
MKKAKVLVLVVCLVLVLLAPTLVQAQGGLTILDSSAKAEFPLQLHFSLSAESDVDIADIRLHYTVDRESFAQVTSEVYIEFAPDTTVDAKWSWDMRRTGGLPPGSVVEYWWTVKDVSGNKAETTPARVSFDDNRYVWRELTEDKVTIHWYEGRLPFAAELMSAAQQALTRLTEDTGAFLKKPAEIYIYASTDDLQSAMIFPQEWTGGRAYTKYGIIVLGIDQGNISWGKTSIAHELTHLVVHQMTFNPYISLPTWLEEGLATYNEGELEPQLADSLERAVNNNSLISVRSLSSPFSAYTRESLLSYAQSYSLVEFLITTYGQDKMLELLTTFSQGSNYDGALEKVYGFDMDGLNILWQNYAVEHYQKAGANTATASLSSALITDLPLAIQTGAGGWS